MDPASNIPVSRLPPFSSILLPPATLPPTTLQTPFSTNHYTTVPRQIPVSMLCHGMPPIQAARDVLAPPPPIPRAYTYPAEIEQPPHVTTLKELNTSVLAGLTGFVRPSANQNVIIDGYDPRNYPHLSLETHIPIFCAWAIQLLSQLNSTGYILLLPKKYLVGNPSIRLLNHMLHDLEYEKGAQLIYKILAGAPTGVLAQNISLFAKTTTDDKLIPLYEERIEIPCGTLIHLMMAYRRPPNFESEYWQNEIKETVTLYDKASRATGTLHLRRSVLSLFQGYHSNHGTPEENSTFNSVVNDCNKVLGRYPSQKHSLEEVRTSWIRLIALKNICYPNTCPANLAWLNHPSVGNFVRSLRQENLPNNFPIIVQQFKHFVFEGRTTQVEAPISGEDIGTVNSVQPRNLSQPAWAVFPTPFGWTQQIAQLAAIVLDKQDKRTHLAEICEVIRSRKLEDSIRTHRLDASDQKQMVIDNILKGLENWSESIEQLAALYTVKIYDRSINGNYVLAHEYNSGQQYCVQIGRRNVDGSILYDILLPK
ncbi:MAG: hypothetical protein Q8K75_00460 [Chlamydiales bacterium]|nr:hypothetical protein [Chlamydiales bacterium]